MSTCFEHDIFHNNLKNKCLWASLFLQILKIATKIGIHYRLFCGDNFTSKNFKKLSLVESLFSIRHEYSLQTTTLLNASQMISWGRSEIAALKTLENYQKTICSEIPFYHSCTNTVYSLLLDCTTDTFWKCSERKGCSKILKIPKNLNCLSFSNAAALQPRISDFSKHRLQEIFRNLPEKRL